MHSWFYRWCDRRLIQQANAKIRRLRGIVSELERRLDEAAERNAHQVQLLDDEIERLNAHVDALVTHNAELAASRSLLSDVEEGRHVTAAEALRRMTTDDD